MPAPGAVSAMAQAATPEQLLRWAPECFGEPGDLKLAALAISEPEGGSDVRNLRTTRRAATATTGCIDGHKMWIGNGGIANVHVVNATVDPELGHRGQALFVVPGGTPGLELVRKLDKLGCRASHTAELRFDGCASRATTCSAATPSSRRGCERGARGRRGDSATLGAFEQTRPMVAAQALGIARAALEFATRLRDRARGVRRPDHRQAGRLVPARRPRRRPRRRPAADLARGVDGGQPRAVPARRGLDEQAQGVRGRGARHRAGDPDLRRLGLHLRPARSRSGTATRSSTRSSRARARSSGW